MSYFNAYSRPAKASQAARLGFEQVEGKFLPGAGPPGPPPLAHTGRPGRRPQDYIDSCPTSQLGVQAQRLASHDVDLLNELRDSQFPNLNVVTAGTQVHRLSLVRRAREGAIYQHFGVLHFGVQLNLTRGGIAVAVVSRTPIG